MVQVKLLKGLIKENDETLEDYSKVIGKSVTTLQERLKGKSEFLRSELLKTKEHYNLSDERFLEIFFKN